MAVTASAKEIRRQTIADDLGRFEFHDLTPDDYVVTATLSGFRTIRRNVKVADSGSTTIEFFLHMDCIAEVQYVVQDAATIWRESSMVAHFRVVGRSEPIRFDDDCGQPAYGYSVKLIRELKNPFSLVPTQPPISLFTQIKLEPKREYVAWLAWEPATEAYGIMSNADTALISSVNLGRVDWKQYVPEGISRRSTVATFFDQIASLAHP